MLALTAEDAELVAVALRGVRDEQFPVAEATHAHRMAFRIPEIEVADDADLLRGGCEHDERHTGNALYHNRMGAEFFIKLLMSSLAEQIKVIVGQDRWEAIGVVEVDHPFAKTGAQLIRSRAIGKDAGKQAVVMNARQRRRLAVRVDRVDLLRFGQKGAHDRLAVFLVGPRYWNGSAWRPSRIA